MAKQASVQTDNEPDDLDSFRKDTRSLAIAIAIAGAAIVLAYVVKFGIEPSSSQEVWGQFGDYVGGLVNPLVGLVTFFAVLATVYQNRQLMQSNSKQLSYIDAERRFERSREIVSTSVTGLHAAVNSLRAAGNERLLWISAARLLAEARKLGEQVTEDVHRSMWNIEAEQARQVISDLLGYQIPGQHQSVTASFFYGVDASLPIEMAALVSTSEGHDKAIPLSPLRELWNFARYPSEYNDPLAPVSAWDPDESIEMVTWPALREYLRHRNKFHSVNGQLVPKEAM